MMFFHMCFSSSSQAHPVKQNVDVGTVENTKSTSIDKDIQEETLCAIEKQIPQKWQLTSNKEALDQRKEKFEEDEKTS